MAPAKMAARPSLLRFPGRRLKEKREGSGACARTSSYKGRPGSSVVERGPEKAGVGGSIPSLATTLLNNLAGWVKMTAPALESEAASQQTAAWN